MNLPPTHPFGGPGLPAGYDSWKQRAPDPAPWDEDDPEVREVRCGSCSRYYPKHEDPERNSEWHARGYCSRRCQEE